MGHGQDKKKSGGGGTRSVGRIEGRKSQGESIDSGTADRERTESRSGAVVQNRGKIQEKFLIIRERSRILIA